MKDDRILGEKENLAPGLSGTFSLALEPGDYIVVLPGCGDASSTHVHRDRRDRRSSRAPRRRPPPRWPTRRGDRGTPLRAGPVGTARRGDDGLRRRGRRPATSTRRRRCTARPASTTSGSSRSPRASVTSTRDRRPRSTTSPAGRRGPASTGSRRRSGTTGHRPAMTADRRLSSLADVDELKTLVADGDVPAGAARQRRGRAARRGRQVEDHRRGGALLAHRPASTSRPTSTGPSRRSTLLRPGARARSTRRWPTTIDGSGSPTSQTALDASTGPASGFVAVHRSSTHGQMPRRSPQAVDALAEPLSQVAGEGRR